MDIIKDATKLNAYIGTTLKTYQSTGVRLHTAIVSAIWHAAMHGQPALLDKVYDGLRSNDKQAMKMYIRRAHAVIGLAGKDPDGLDADVIVKAVADGQVIDHKQGKFVIVRGHTSDQAKALVSLCEKRYINADGDKEPRVLDRNNFAEVRTLGDQEVLKQIIKLAASLEGNSERTKVSVSQSVKDWIKKLSGEAETRLDQLTLNEG